MSFSWLSANYKKILIIFLLLACGCILYENAQLKREYGEKLIVLNDSIVTYKNRVGELYAAQNTYIADVKKLKDINASLSAEVKSLKDNPLVVTITKIETHIDTIEIQSEVEKEDSVLNYKWEAKDEWYAIDGASSINLNNSIATTYINDLSFYNELTLDVVENKDKELQILVKSDSPYCNIKNIQGAIISPEKIKSISSSIKQKNRWGIGVQLGYGTYIDNLQQIHFSPYFGAGVTYNIITF